MTVWFLLIMMTSGSGVAVIPQASEQECKRQAAYIMDNRMDVKMPSYAYCTPGVK